jgi:hypothetical protein
MTSAFRGLAAALLLTGASAAFVAVPARAELSRAQFEEDSITLSLSAERWVESSTARVVVSINTAVEGAQAGRVRTDMLAALATLAGAKTEWRFVEFNRTPDSSGLERWYAQVEARMPEPALGGLADAAKKASRPGLQLEVAGLDFTPTLPELEAARAALRASIYAQAVDEQKSLTAAIAGRTWRIATVTFHPESNVPPSPSPKTLMRSEAMSASADFGGAAIGVATKLSLTAMVVLASE